MNATVIVISQGAMEIGGLISGFAGAVAGTPSTLLEAAGFTRRSDSRHLDLRAKSVSPVVVQVGVEEANDKAAAHIVAEQGKEKVLAHM